MKIRVLFGYAAIICCLSGANNILQAQTQSKKPLDHSVYNIWNTLGGYSITDDGKYASCYKTRAENDGSIIVINLKKGISTEIPRGNKSKFSNNGKFIVFTIRPTYLQQKDKKLLKAPESKKPKDTLAIMELANNKIIKVPDLKRLEMADEEGNFIAYKIGLPQKDTSSKAKKKTEEVVIVCDLNKNALVDTLKNIDDFKFDKTGKRLICIRKGDTKEVIIYNPKEKNEKCILSGYKKADIQLSNISKNGKMLAIYANLDTAKKFNENVEIYTYLMGSDKAIKVLDNKTKGIPEGMIISKNRALTFSKNCGRLFFGICYPEPQKDTTINDDDIAALDVWNYKDKYLATEQLNMKGQMLKQSYLSVIQIDTLSGKSLSTNIVTLANKKYPFVRVADDWSCDYAYAWSDEEYISRSQWDRNPIGDLYIISLKDGSSELVKKGIYAYSLTASPKGKYITWYAPVEKQYYAMNITSHERNIVNITKSIKVPLWNEINDQPIMTGSYGNGGWSDDEQHFYIYDKYDIWDVDPSGIRVPQMVTNGEGRAKKITFNLMRWDEMQLPKGTPGGKNTPIKKEDNLYFTAFDNTSKGYGYFMRENKKGQLLPMKQLIMEPNFSLGYLNKAKKANVITFVKSNFTESPNLWMTTDMFKTSKKLTEANPQQANYNWGTCELVNWKAKDGLDLEGLLFKPENFNPENKYPMVVYFYERNSDNKNIYRKPAVSRSTINVSYFVSNGYLVFIPDIAYKIGHPGQSAMNCIIPGVEKLCENKWVDSENMAIQGQSWGGYQVAYMITQTGMFKCAGAGAPVSNMTSAYGGIRWGSGVVREFQYEQTQSRIGKNLWEEGGLDLYIENSPLFYADKVTTPLLIMHNDKDDAVPWYQGIEYFTGLRRLGKQVWMLQYNNETHNLSKYVNSLDYTKRLSQFMDHFLKGAPAPVWMEYGIPATEKGINMGLDLVK